jgi:hypothetical protein
MGLLLYLEGMLQHGIHYGDYGSLLLSCVITFYEDDIVFGILYYNMDIPAGFVKW